MCLAVPARIIEIDGDTAVLDMEGVRREAIMSLIDDPKPGDYVLLHAGFAIRKWSEEDVREWREIFELNRDQLDSADHIRPGMVLQLPPLERD